MPDLEILVLAAVAIFILSRLYLVLGRRTGNSDPLPSPAERTAKARQDATQTVRTGEMSYSGPGSEALQNIAEHDTSFSLGEFLSGARKAYTMIVTAFADKDRDTLKNMVTEDVYTVYCEQIDAMDDSQMPFRLARLKSADISDAQLSSDRTASISVLFGAEMRLGSASKDVSEIWTFCRSLYDSDPNWRLAEVDVAP